MKAKNGLLVSGILIIIICYFLPLAYGCNGLTDDGNVKEFAISGSQYFPYYISNSFLLLIVTIGFAGRDLWAKVIIFILIGAGTISTLMLFLIMLAGFGQPCGQAPSAYYALMFIGQAIVIIISVLSLYRKSDLKRKNSEIDF